MRLSRNLFDRVKLAAALKSLLKRNLSNFGGCFAIVRIRIQPNLVRSFGLVEQPAALAYERRNDLVLDKNQALDVVVVSRKYRAAHDHLFLEAGAAKREHVDLGAVGPAVAVLDDAVRRHRDEDGAAQGRVQKQLLELVISVMPDLANELHGVSELLVLGVS